LNVLGNFPRRSPRPLKPDAGRFAFRKRKHNNFGLFNNRKTRGFGGLTFRCGFPRANRLMLSREEADSASRPAVRKEAWCAGENPDRRNGRDNLRADRKKKKLMRRTEGAAAASAISTRLRERRPLILQARLPRGNTHHASRYRGTVAEGFRRDTDFFIYSVPFFTQTSLWENLRKILALAQSNPKHQLHLIIKDSSGKAIQARSATW